MSRANYALWHALEAQVRRVLHLRMSFLKFLCLAGCDSGRLNEQRRGLGMADDECVLAGSTAITGIAAPSAATVSPCSVFE